MSDPVELPPKLCPATVELLESVVACELPNGHASRGQTVHYATVYGVVRDRSVPVVVKWHAR